MFPNEILTLIFQYHRKNIRKNAADKKNELHDELKNKVEPFILSEHKKNF